MYGHICRLEGSWGGWGASLAPPGPASVFARSIRGFILNTKFIAYFGAVNLSDRHCLHPCSDALSRTKNSAWAAEIG